MEKVAPIFTYPLAMQLGEAPPPLSESAAELNASVAQRYAESCTANASAVHTRAHQLTVPRLVHQTWKSCDLLPRQRSWWDRCARLSPRWSMRLWTDDANRAFMAAHYPQHLSMYDGYRMNIMRVDAIRYFLLYHYGGVYMDLDFACVRSLEALPLRHRPGHATLILQRKSLFDKEAASNAFMAAPPRHPFFAFVIEELAGSARMVHVLDATGPRFLTRVWRAWIALPAHILRRDQFNVTIASEPWALLHRVHSCRPSNRPGPPCVGPYNFAPCKTGTEPELDKCARTMPHVGVTTFWTGTWVPAFAAQRGSERANKTKTAKTAKAPRRSSAVSVNASAQAAPAPAAAALKLKALQRFQQQQHGPERVVNRSKAGPRASKTEHLAPDADGRGVDQQTFV